MRGFIVGTVATAIAFWIVAVVFPEYLGLDFLTYEGDIVGLLVLALIFGVRQSQALFIGPLNTATGLGIATISLAFAWAQLMWGLTQPVAGALADRLDRRRCRPASPDSATARARAPRPLPSPAQSPRSYPPRPQPLTAARHAVRDAHGCLPLTDRARAAHPCSSSASASVASRRRSVRAELTVAASPPSASSMASS